MRRVSGRRRCGSPGFPRPRNWGIASCRQVRLRRRVRSRTQVSAICETYEPFLKRAAAGAPRAEALTDWRRVIDINLNGVWPGLPPLDLVLLRNVLIYFDVRVRQQILGQVRQVLQPDGYLLLGGAETTHNLDDGFISDPVAQGSFFRLRPPVPAGVSGG